MTARKGTANIADSAEENDAEEKTNFIAHGNAVEETMTTSLLRHHWNVRAAVVTDLLVVTDIDLLLLCLVKTLLITARLVTHREMS